MSCLEKGSLLTICFLIGISVYADRIEEKYVSCLNSRLHEEKSAFSNVVKNLCYGEKVSVFCDENASEDNIKWLEVEVQGQKGYVPKSVLISERLFERQKEGKRTMADRAEVGKKGFSEDEKGDMRAMRGAFGVPKKEDKRGDVNYRKIDLLIAESAKQEPSDSDLKRFREQGKIGEFKAMEVRK